MKVLVTLPESPRHASCSLPPLPARSRYPRSLLWLHGHVLHLRKEALGESDLSMLRSPPPAPPKAQVPASGCCSRVICASRSMRVASSIVCTIFFFLLINDSNSRVLEEKGLFMYVLKLIQSWFAFNVRCLSFLGGQTVM